MGVAVWRVCCEAAGRGSCCSATAGTTASTPAVRRILRQTCLAQYSQRCWGSCCGAVLHKLGTQLMQNWVASCGANTASCARIRRELATAVFAAQLAGVAPQLGVGVLGLLKTGFEERKTFFQQGLKPPSGVLALGFRYGAGAAVQPRWLNGELRAIPAWVVGSRRGLSSARSALRAALALLAERSSAAIFRRVSQGVARDEEDLLADPTSRERSLGDPSEYSGRAKLGFTTNN